MIKQIQNIGEYVERTYPEKSPVESMVNRINSEDMKYVLIANIQDGKVTYNTVDFYRNVTIYYFNRSLLAGNFDSDRSQPTFF